MITSTTIIILLSIIAIFGCFIIYFKSRTLAKILLENQRLSERNGELNAQIEPLKITIAEYEQKNNILSNQIAEMSQELEKFKRIAISNEALLKQEQNHAKQTDELLKTVENSLFIKLKAMSSDIATQNSENFLKLAQESLAKYANDAKNEFKHNKESILNIISPIHDTLKSFDDKVALIEKDRISSHESLKEQISGLLNAQNNLQHETANLVSALKSPNLRGKWGEMQLKRLLEISGMMPYCDFEEQLSIENDSKILRPDVIINLPENRKIVIDAKTPVLDYIQAVNSNDSAAQGGLLKNYLKSINDHICKLSSKKYYENVAVSPEFVIMFLPGESFFSAALHEDPFIIEKAMKLRVIIATPSTLLAMLNTISVSWKQFNITNNLKDVLDAGEKLCKQISNLSVSFQKIGKNLKNSVTLYNESVVEIEEKLFKRATDFSQLISKNNSKITAITGN